MYNIPVHEFILLVPPDDGDEQCYIPVSGVLSEGMRGTCTFIVTTALLVVNKAMHATHLPATHAGRTHQF